jgi:hypothetical protein
MASTVAITSNTLAAQSKDTALRDIPTPAVLGPPTGSLKQPRLSLFEHGEIDDRERRSRRSRRSRRKLSFYLPGDWFHVKDRHYNSFVKVDSEC